MGAAQWVLAGQVEGTVEGAQAAIERGQCLVADTADFAAGGGDGVDLFFAGACGQGKVSKTDSAP